MSGISGMSLYVPRLRVSLEDWCRWNGASWDKVKAIVGNSFRVCAAHENVYTMAANAVLRLILQYEVDPSSIGFLGFGTESSTDNAAGAVIVKGIVDEGLMRLGRAPIARTCEVPEFKQACLAGLYALKGGLRYLEHDGRGRTAIVVSADIAEYERGSSGEQTQGAGAVAMLLEGRPRMLRVDLGRSGSASSYRGVDFRKPFARHFAEGYAAKTQRLHDFPIFNGRYSTFCYLDEVARAVDAMLERSNDPRGELLDRASMILFHRPYQHLPEHALSTILVRQIARRDRTALEQLAKEAGASPDAVVEELASEPSLFQIAKEKGVEHDPYPETSKLVRVVRKSPKLEEVVRQKTGHGKTITRELGNLYSASLPAWLGAALEESIGEVDLANETLVMVGYGSGDAAEAIPVEVVPGWEAAARKLAFAEALAEPVPLTREAYEEMHDGTAPARVEPRSEFVVERVGEAMDPTFQDLGVEYYAFVDR